MSEAHEAGHEDLHDGGSGIEAAGQESPTAEMAAPHAARPSVWRFVFTGPSGLRPGWGLLLFLTIYISLSGISLAVMHRLRPEAVHPGASKATQQGSSDTAIEQTPSFMLIVEGSGFAFVALTTWIMGKIERRPTGRYGFGGTRRTSLFLQGFIWGLASLVALVGTLWKLKLLVFERRLLFGPTAWKYGAVWMLGFLLVGLLEEYLLRGYLQYTIARGAAALYGMLFDTRHGEMLGFWTSAALLSFVFGFGHIGNRGESPIGLWSAGLIGAIFCLTLWKTGALWWALGFHASWDWAQSFVFGVADSGTMVQGHLYASHPAGGLVLSGGATGPEGSVFILPLLAIVALVAVWTLPERRWSIG